MNKRVVITGLGVVSPIGIGKDAFWKALEDGVCGIDYIQSFDPSEFPVKIAAEVKAFEPETYMPRKDAKRADRVIQFATAASKMALEDSKLNLEEIDATRFGVYIGTGQGGITTCFDNVELMLNGGHRKVSPFFIPMMITNMSAAYVAIQVGAKGPNMCVTTACASGVNSIGEAYRALQRGDVDLMLAGGSEAGVKALCVAGFAAMKALSTNPDPDKACRPFDKDRDGFIIGEGAGVVVLEELEHAKRRGAHIYAEVVGYGNTCDAGHITAPDAEGDGAARSMQIAIREAGLDFVDYINAHGTSTGLNDAMESKAINRIFGDRAPEIAVTATKSLIGHGLGAAGGMEVVATMQAFEQGIIHKTRNLDNQDSECNVTVVTENMHRDVESALCNSFGFGGHNAVLCFKKYDE